MNRCTGLYAPARYCGPKSLPHKGLVACEMCLLTIVVITTIITAFWKEAP